MDRAAAPGSIWPRLCAELPSLTRSAETAVVISAYGPLTRAPLRSSMAAGNRNREGGFSQQDRALRESLYHLSYS